MWEGVWYRGSEKGEGRMEGERQGWKEGEEG